ncbi:maf protein [Beutenbergia cavernae DSM 12333]|uniref:Nucleoside triphosphate pyrophosphatase n=1 Tax=Beutenbergia cavernae (strain ATCC BAA-8 / DSM 12333 / CCUG 43141 / JCM 11478 / NBRC 16432 / NCIMB 13614 / HKI 0122) TaxID=471853 RepID=C5C0Z6_BEUC1|nr:Maf family protein [Beutenbergia cavernae]ACQ79400.1 maf protein [Beutenbergia cavernae DSM 12333]
MSTPFVLASGSPARLTTLRAAGIEPRVVVSDVDEDAALADAERAAGAPLPVGDQALLLARAKAEAVAARISPAADGDASPAEATPSSSLVLGCDSILELAGASYGKPGTVDVARERWQAMRGRTGVLHTGHWLIAASEEARASGPGRAVGGTSATLVEFADVDDDELEAYLATGEPLAVAGAFTIDGLGGAFVTRIEGDHHGVVGLSLPLLRGLVRELGLAYPDLWEHR